MHITRRRHFRDRQKGSILLLGVVSMFVMLGFVGLALDACYMYFHKRAMQTAADAGAYGAALELLRGGTATTAAAKNDTALNGFADGTNSVSVTVNSPPTSGSKSGNTSFVEVIISHPQPTWFMRALNYNSITVKARAVAGLGATGNGCVYALNQDISNQNNGFFVNGTTDSTFSCGVFSNANFRSVGGACVVTPTVSYTGAYTNANNSGNCGPAGIGKGVPIVDPLAHKYSIPSHSTCTQTNYKVTGGTTVNIPAGIYCGGISISGSVTSVIFGSGQFVLVDGGLSINGSVAVSGTDVTFFNTYTSLNKYGGISISGSGTVTLRAPTTGTYAGLLFYQDPTVTWAANNGSSIAGAANSVYDGIIYFPTTDLTYSGNSSTSSTGTDGYTTLIGYNVKIAGTAQINSDYSTLTGGNPLQNALFAE
jgi:hypothetical protein